MSSNLPALHVVNNLLPRTNDLAHGCPSWFILIPNCCYVGIGTRAYTTAFDELWSTRVTSVNWANTEKYNWKRYKGRITVLILGTDHLTWRLWFFVLFRIFFSDNTRVRMFIFFFRAPREIFFQNITLGYITKTLNQIIFFSAPISEYFFQQHWES